MRYNFAVEHALLELTPAGPVVRAQSAGVTPALEAALGVLAVDSGARGATGTPTLFAHPVGRGSVAVVRVSGVRFYAFVWHRATYAQLGDPFQLADAFPADFAAAGDLPALEWPARPLPPRTPGMLAEVLRSTDSPLVLGTAQALLDGARVRFGPDDASEATLRAVWHLLPDRVRCDLWPSTRVTPDTALDFHAAVTAGPLGVPPPGTVTAEQARDYPEGAYELAVQQAVESDDAHALAALLARRSSREVMRLAAGLVVIAMLGAACLKLAG